MKVRRRVRQDVRVKLLRRLEVYAVQTREMSSAGRQSGFYVMEARDLPGVQKRSNTRGASTTKCTTQDAREVTFPLSTLSLLSLPFVHAAAWSYQTALPASSFTCPFHASSTSFATGIGIAT